MKLYYVPGACSLSPHIVALEAGIQIELDKVDVVAKKTQSGGDYLSINPKGYVPALGLDDGSVLTEGSAIVQYLADQRPASKLAPAAGTMDRYRLQEWLAFLGSELHKSYGLIFNPKSSADCKAIAFDNINRRLSHIHDTLTTKQYLLGDTFTVADAYAFTILSWSSFMKVDLNPFANILGYVKRIGSRPKVLEALRGEGLA